MEIPSNAAIPPRPIEDRGILSTNMMKVICILCDQTFTPTKFQARKVIKHPHKIQICETCHQRISAQVMERENKA
jgi:uncharacterized protein YlaI